MSIRKLVSGIFFCPVCEQEYVLEHVLEDEAVCPECGGELDEIETEEDSDEAEGESES